VDYKNTGAFQKLVAPITKEIIGEYDKTGITLPAGTELVVRDLSERRWPDNPNAAVWLRVVMFESEYAQQLLRAGRSNSRLRRLFPRPSIANAAPIPATQDMPAEMKAMLTPNSGMYIRLGSRPKLDFATEPVPGVPGIWRVIGISDEEKLLTTIPGQEQIELTAEGTAAKEAASTEGYRPPWASLDICPSLCRFGEIVAKYSLNRGPLRSRTYSAGPAAPSV
jgi:hypothetical protein